MIYTRRILTSLSIKMRSERNFFLIEILAFSFWYLSLFPGRLGFDYSETIRLIQRGESTDWWTALFFWFMKLSSFWGKSIYISSFLCLLILTISIKFFISSIPAPITVLRKVHLSFILTPLYGVFGVTVSHDVTQTAGILIALGLQFRKYSKVFLSRKQELIYSLIASVLLLTTKTGYVVVFFLIAQFFLEKKSKQAIFITLSISFIYICSSFGIKQDASNLVYQPFLADLKCIAQHPEARLTNRDWAFLELYADKAIWTKPISCASMDGAMVSFDATKFADYSNTDFVKKYLNIVFKNPAIAIMAHIQRSSNALPPPFFQVPLNQVDLNVNNPIGLNTNTMLQQGPELLHPSIDEPSVKIKTGFLRYLEAIALLPAFVINQASWFWGWGGMWCWVLLIYALKTLQIFKIRKLLMLYYPVITTHLTLFLVGPVSVPRYVMSSILIGVILSLTLLFSNNFNHKKSQLP